jgi:hypothetical protein
LPRFECIIWQNVPLPARRQESLPLMRRIYVGQIACLLSGLC